MKILPITQLTVERLSLISDKPFASVLAAIRGGIGHPNMNKLWEEIWGADSFQRIESIVKPVLGPTGLMQFGEFDDGGFIRKDRGEGTPQPMRVLIGNPLIMKQMTELVHEVPVRLILGVDAEKRVQQAEAARASEAERWRHLTVSTVLEDGRFDSRLYTANSGIDS